VTTTGYATTGGTAAFAARFPAQRDAGFFRDASGLSVSSLGLGTYLGEMDEATDDAYAEAVVAAVTGGINVLDAAINYRHQRSERSIGEALQYLFDSGAFRREEIVVCTKAGFLTPGAISPATLPPEEVVGRMHSMAPDFLEDQIGRSQSNLGLETIDVFYLHNPETQLPHLSADQFDRRIRRAFARLEKLVAAGKIRWYGTATWDGYRKAGGLDLGRLVEIAREEGGAGHHFRFVQLPFNLAMPEAFHRGVFEVARMAGIAVVASASLLQARLTHGMPDEVKERLPGFSTDAQRAIQFTRSTPGITVALVGMSRTAHVNENLAVSVARPLERDEYLRFYA
jgi:aryl-alcohol dehydrogenase-like predicted oxidoreductase